ncbi:EAL and HDOD domain-containing protein [Ketobacter sp.]|uniref:EAL and HDOD domain-containing protein n=1 Tax=Ketobacter sp. TaxID=2083498 RepID=UPI000F17A0C1|nr:HDOD domain-containing protein [Ketobacter sp.]RLT96921.1 MAG: HDOD domain-containing protein [Ketobacter sp.]
MKIYLARQPVFDRNLNAVAYELLFRNGNVGAAVIDDPTTATMQVMVNAFSEIGLEQITCGKPALVNITHDILVRGDLPKGLQSLLIPEVLEDVVVDGNVIQEVKNLVDLGYKVALDDFVYSDAWRPLIGLAHYIKLDVMALGVNGVKEQLARLRACGNVKGKLLAEKVETHEEYELYRALGFDYFQGYFISKPHVMSGQSVPASHHVLQSLLVEVSKDDYDVDKVAGIIAQDPRLSYKLMRVVNSASFGLSRTVKSIEDTIVLLGAYELKRWAGMLAFSVVDSKPNELLVTAILRAKMCELLAQRLKRPQPGSYFTAGLLSLLDALLDRSLEDILRQMPLSAELEMALLTGSGDIGQVLSSVNAYEEARLDPLQDMDMDVGELGGFYLEALQWAEVARNSMLGA